MHPLQVETSAGDKPYSDLGIVQELRKMQNDAKKASRVAPRVSGPLCSPARTPRTRAHQPAGLPCEAPRATAARKFLHHRLAAHPPPHP
jgi:hypothetical protein